MKFKNENDKWLAITALNTAAERWDEDAKEHPALARQFTDQAEAARRIASEIEESDS